MQEERYSHCMAAGNDGRVYILGGRLEGVYTGSVEAVDTALDISERAGELRHKACCGLACCTANNRDYILVCGANDLEGHPTIQVYCVRNQATTHVVPLPVLAFCAVYGVLNTGTHILVFARDYTAVAPLQDVLEGRGDRVHMLHHRYWVPHNRCGLAFTPDRSRVLMVGGIQWPTPSYTHFMYHTHVSSLLGDTEEGWQALDIPWPSVGEIVQSYDVAMLSLPVQ